MYSPYEIANWLNKEASDDQFAEVFALLEIMMNGRGNFNCYDTDGIILNMKPDVICNRIKTILNEIQNITKERHEEN